MLTKYSSRESSRNSCFFKERSPTKSLTLFFLATSCFLVRWRLRLLNIFLVFHRYSKENFLHRICLKKKSNIVTRTLIKWVCRVLSLRWMTTILTSIFSWFKTTNKIYNKTVCLIHSSLPVSQIKVHMAIWLEITKK